MHKPNRLLRPVLLGGLLVLLMLPPVAHAEDRDPTPAELAEMILTGNDAEHALVGIWLEQADRAYLRSVFAALRDLRRPPTVTRVAQPEPLSAASPEPSGVDRQQIALNAQIRVIDIVPGHAGGLLGRFQPTAAKTWHILTGAEAQDLLRSVEKSADATIIRAPQILVQDGQSANVSILDQVSYIKDYDIEVGMGGVQVANPIIDTIQDGMVIDLKGHVDENGSDIHLDFVGTWAALKRPIPEFTKEIAGHSLTFQIPEMNVTRARATTLMPNNGWALIGGGAIGHGDEKRERIALVNVQTVDLASDAHDAADMPPASSKAPVPVKKK